MLVGCVGVFNVSFGVLFLVVVFGVFFSPFSIS